jgi:methionyl-tRNA synthetase
MIAAVGEDLRFADDTASIIAITAPPPTPNGDLHLGHLAGPYLWADVLHRYVKMRGRRSVSALSVDLNQTYVVTSANQLGVDPNDLAQQSYREIAATLSAAGMQSDLFGMPDAKYTAYVQSWFASLYAAGTFQRVQSTIPFDASTGRFLFEAYASGCCPTCLSETKGNICEACGHSNEPAQLLNLRSTGAKHGAVLERRLQPTLVMNLEHWRQPLTKHISGVFPELRPKLRRLVEELLSEPLPTFPITFPSAWGIPAPFPDCDGLVINVWAEMVPGHYYWLEQAYAVTGGTSALIGGKVPVKYVQCLGFDNSFFYVFAQLALALAAREAGIPALLPDVIVTNEFYQLNNFKFSTSQQHVIWGHDFLQSVPSDEARFYFAWSNPETQESNFCRDDFDAIVNHLFRTPSVKLLEFLSRSQPLKEPLKHDFMAMRLLSRFEAAYNPDHPSLRLAAQTLANGLRVTLARAQMGENEELIRPLAKALAIGAAPLVPALAAKLWRILGNDGLTVWPTGKTDTTLARSQ